MRSIETGCLKNLDRKSGVHKWGPGSVGNMLMMLDHFPFDTGGSGHSCS